ncbi:THAP domain [Popillia japonica]|uniref:THAP domain n=1 Tax=Popillia japonica TaxID=7064 RepID=A0AAW1I943_POPJA
MSPRKCFLCGKGTKLSVTLHKFPKDKPTRLRWLKICNLNANDDVCNIKICSDHFTTELIIVVHNLQEILMKHYYVLRQAHLQLEVQISKFLTLNINRYLEKENLKNQGMQVTSIVHSIKIVDIQI